MAFIGVALAALAVNTAVNAWSLDRDVSAVLGSERLSQVRSLALAAGAAHHGAGWPQADLMPVMDVAAQAGAAVQVRDRAGRLVTASPGYGALPRRSTSTYPVTWERRPIGRISIRFSSGGLTAIARSFEERRWHARLIAAGIAALIALIVSIAIARAISGPLERMLEAVRARGAGERSVRITQVRGIGVVRELQESFNDATNALDNQERVHRDLVANVAHELRTPVAVLQASLEAMADGLTELNPGAVGSLHHETVRLGRMIDDLQRLSAAEAAVLRLNLAEHDLADIAADAASTLRGSFAAAGIGLVQWLRPTLVRCDAARMHEVVSNLLTNALKFTPAGGKVELETAPDAGGGWIKVTDSGCGIPADELPRVTERFYRGKASPGMADGSGIGLAIVAELSKAHGGDLRIVSESGQGTEVTVTVPAG